MKTRNPIKATKPTLVLLVLVLCSLCVLVPANLAFARPWSPPESVISNRASATYQDQDGTTFQTESETIIISVLAVPALSITPDDTAPTATIFANDHLVRAFRLCNSGNREDFFLPTRGEVTSPSTISNIYFDTDDSGTITPADLPVQIGTTLTPLLQPQACLNVLFAIDTNNISPQAQMTVSLSARSTLRSPNGSYAQDDGTIINVTEGTPVFTSPTDSSLPPVALVDGLPRTTGASGQSFTYTIAFHNQSKASARQVRVVDELPPEMQYIAGTLRLNSRSLTDASDDDEGTGTPRQIKLLIPDIGPDALTVVEFQARLGTAESIGNGVVNLATISAANAAPINSSNAVIVVNPIGTVFAGNSGGATRVAGAIVTLAVDETGAPLSLVPDTGYEPNAGNENPFSANASGGFGFVLAADQIGTAGSPARYVLNVTAPGYRPRHLEVSVHPMGAAGFHQATIRSLDGQAIAVANGFSLTEVPVVLNDLAALAFNVPLFELSTLEINKTADKQFAEIGDIVSYRIQVKNATASSLHDLIVRDLLPSSFVYATGTAQLEIGTGRTALNPVVNGSELNFAWGELGAGLSATITYRIRIGASAREGDQTNAATAQALLLNGVRVTTQPAVAVVRVRGGVFSMRQLIIGRVFEDLNNNGQFDAGERPVSGARIYQNNGQSVVTDSAGQYNFPAAGSGSIVLSLDPISLPTGYLLLDDAGRKSSDSWTRLLRTPLGGGALLRQNFAIAPSKPEFAIPSSSEIVTAPAAASVAPVQTTVKTLTPKHPAPVSAIPVAAASNLIELPMPVLVGSLGNSPTRSPGTSSATFVEAATEVTEPVAAGDLLVISPRPDDVIQTPALSIDVRVANDWVVEAMINGSSIASTNVGEKRVDNRNHTTTYSYVGISLRPGPNAVKLTATSATGQRGKISEFTIFGRGPAETLEIVRVGSTNPNGTEPLSFEIRGFDRWHNPAADGQVSIETSAGKLLVKQLTTTTAGANETAPPARQAMVSLSNGTAIVQLANDGTADSARLKVVAGTHQATTDIRFIAALRPTLLVGLAELAVGRNAPEISSTGDDVNVRGGVALFYRGRVFGDSLLTLAYDSRHSLNRIAGQDRFGLFDPLDRTYPVFGDSSERFEDAQSNSRLYFRLDHGRSFLMFGDMIPDLDELALTGYSRRLTGAKLHLENAAGDFVAVTAARPNTAFARDVIPAGGLSLVHLSHGDLLPGSEVVALELRDRRNPEIIINRETLIRSIDYDLNAQTGELIFLRPISTFDDLLNLTQIVITYEYRGTGSTNSVYTGRAVRHFPSLGLRVGATYVNQQQGEIGAFQLGGIDIEKKMPRGGVLNLEAAISNGRFAAGVNVFDFYQAGFTDATQDQAGREYNGRAVRVTLDQPLPFFSSKLKIDYQRSTANFYNPFGATITPGNQRFAIDLEMHPGSKHTFAFGFVDERNKTTRVDNSRQTLGFLWSERWRENFRTILGFEHRNFGDNLTGREVNSNLITAAIEYRPTSKFELSIKREQNLTEADPTYPNQTTLAAKYQISANAKLFFTQRLASAAITPIGDFSNNGFASVGSQRETAFGIETKVAHLGAVSGRYQIENGINGPDGFAVIGLQNRWALNKELSVEAGFERGFLVNGSGRSFNAGTVGAAWTRGNGFRAAARYEVRDRNGFGQLVSIGAAGKIGDNWTTLARGQWTRTRLNERRASASTISGALAYRPLESDRYALLFSYENRAVAEEGRDLNGIRQAALRDRSDTLSADGLYQVNQSLELYGRFALRFNGNGNNTNLYASATTYLAQVRAQQRINNYLDIAIEGRWLTQPVSGTRRTSFGGELGYWIMPDLRFGLGYNFTGVREPTINLGGAPRRGGFYFTITAKLSRLFDLFGTADVDQPTTKDAPAASGVKPEPK